MIAFLSFLLCLFSTIQALVEINEFHYDNVNVDVNQFIEIRHNESLMGYEIILYNGANGLVYNRTDLSYVATVNAAPKFNYTVVPFKQISNGVEGIALKHPSGSVKEFLSYEGTFTAKNGPAKGMTSKDIIVSESNVCTAVGFSLQKCATNGLWIGPKRATPGKLNRNCTGLTFPSAQKMPPCVVVTAPVMAPVAMPSPVMMTGSNMTKPPSTNVTVLPTNMTV